MKKSIIIFFCVTAILDSCQPSRPKCSEISISSMIDIYERGEISEFSYDYKGSWIRARLNKEASDNYQSLIECFLNEYDSRSKEDFRLHAKVISLEEFKSKLSDQIGYSNIQILIED